MNAKGVYDSEKLFSLILEVADGCPGASGGGCSVAIYWIDRHYAVVTN